MLKVTALLLFVSFVASRAQGNGGFMPRQIHIAFRGVNSDMVVSWSAPNVTHTPLVLFGTSPGSYSNKAMATWTSYYTDFHFNAVLENLSPSTVYYYKCGDPLEGLSEEFSFTTPPAVGTEKPFSVAVYGDMGITNSEGTIARLIDTMPDYDFIFHVGDFAYADDRLGTQTYEDVWNQWQEEVQPIAAHKAYMACPGNHEATCLSVGDFFCDKRLENFTAYNHRFRMPGEESGSNTNMWHSFDYMNAHFIMIDTETDYPDAPEGPNTLWHGGNFGDQLGWLRNDLIRAKNNRHNTPWIVVGGHRPMYTTSRPGIDKLVWNNVTGALRAAVEDMFYEYNVDFFLCGHVHAYERAWPVYRNQTVKSYDNPDYITHIIAGGPGNIENLNTAWVSNTPEWLASRNGEDFGYGILTFHNATAATWTYYRSDDGEVLDTFTLTRNH